jgi:hypothetical protein
MVKRGERGRGLMDGGSVRGFPAASRPKQAVKPIGGPGLLGWYLAAAYVQ